MYPLSIKEIMECYMASMSGTNNHEYSIFQPSTRSYLTILPRTYFACVAPFNLSLLLFTCPDKHHSDEPSLVLIEPDSPILRLDFHLLFLVTSLRLLIPLIQLLLVEVDPANLSADSWLFGASKPLNKSFRLNAFEARLNATCCFFTWRKGSDDLHKLL